jgi:hypothetical protein
MLAINVQIVAGKRRRTIRSHGQMAVSPRASIGEVEGIAL